MASQPKAPFWLAVWAVILALVGLAAWRAGMLDQFGLGRPAGGNAAARQAGPAGGGAAATMGRDDEGRLIFPAVALWAFVPGIRAVDPVRGKDRLINFLVATFEEVVYI